MARKGLRRHPFYDPVPMATLKLKDVKKIYEGGVEAVHAFNLDVADKEFIVLVGPSGCGKSTTLRMIAGLEEISEGEFYIDDVLMNNVEPKDRDIAMVFQSYALYPHMTVYENMAFALKLRKLPKDEIDKRVREAAEILDITEYLDRKPKALSGGQRQRVAIGRAIVRHPKAFLMDEPLSNLDAKLRNQMRAEIILLRKRIDATFIYVTHDQTEAMTLGDRIVIMKDGVVQQVGTPAEVFNRPKNLFVAGFIGAPQMNFFEAKLEKDGDGFAVMLLGERFPLNEKMNAILREKNISAQDVILGVRPEHITLSEKATHPALEASLHVCEMMGSELHLHLLLGEKKIIVRVPTLGLTDEEIDAYNDSRAFHLTFVPEAMHLFDCNTQENLLY